MPRSPPLTTKDMGDPDNSISGLNSPRVSDKYYDKPWGASSDVAEDIRNEYRCGEGEEPIPKKSCYNKLLAYQSKGF